jgi:hypothetical protein
VCVGGRGVSVRGLCIFVIRGGFVEYLSSTYVAQQSVAKIISMTLMNLVTPKAGAKH